MVICTKKIIYHIFLHSRRVYELQNHQEDDNIAKSFLGLNIKKVRRQIMNRLTVVSLACFVMLVMVSVAFAQPCAEDIAEFCSDVKPGEGRISKCLDQHENQLSDKCKTRFEDVKQEVKEGYETCEDYIIIFCPWIRSGEGRILNCLEENKSHLSDECKDNISKAKSLK